MKTLTDCFTWAALVALLALGPGRAPSMLEAQSAADRAAALVAELGVPEAPTPVRDRPGWQRPVRVLVVGGVDPELLADLREAAPGVEVLVARGGPDAIRAVTTADALLGACTSALIEAGPSIRWVQSFTTGVDECATPLIDARGILLTNIQRVLAPTIAEHVMAMTLSIARRLPAYRDNQRDGRWRTDRTPAVSLRGRTMLVLGLGGVGTAVAERAHAFGMTVIAIRSSDRPGPPFVSKVGQPAALLDLLGEADVIVNTLPYTPDTAAMIGAPQFAAAKPGAWFINVGRGETVVTADLVRALESGQIGAAALDVVDPEPLPADHTLWHMPNVIVTPHVAANSELNIDSRWALLRENLRRYVNGDRMLSVVDTSRGY